MCTSLHRVFLHHIIELNRLSAEGISNCLRLITGGVLLPFSFLNIKQINGFLKQEHCIQDTILSRALHRLVRARTKVSLILHTNKNIEHAINSNE